MKQERFIVLRHLTILMMAVLLSSCGDNNGLNISSKKDIDGKRIVVATGTVQDEYAMKHYKNSKIMRVDVITDVVTSLMSNKADVSLIDGTLANLIVKQHPEIGIIDSCLRVNQAGFIFTPSNKVLKDSFNQFFAQLQKDGTASQILDKWEHHADTATMPPMPTDVRNGSFSFVCCAAGPPYSMMKNGVVCGSDVETAVRFAIWAKKRIDINVVNFCGEISGVSVGKFDMAGDEICITEERAKKVAFSLPYKAGNIAAIALRTNLAKNLNSNNAATQVGFWQKMKESLYHNILAEKRYEMLLEGLLYTTIIALASAIFGTLIGMLICYCRMRHNKWIRKTASYVIDFLRGVPQVVFLMILFYLVFVSDAVSGVWVSIIAFALIFGAYVSEMFRTTIEGIDNGQWEAGLSMGFTKVQTFRHFILPLTIQRVLPVYKGEFIGLIKNTSIVGYIAVVDLTKASDMIRSATFDPFFPLIIITLIYFLLIWLLTRLIVIVQIKTVAKRHAL